MDVAGPNIMTADPRQTRAHCSVWRLVSNTIKESRAICAVASQIDGFPSLRLIQTWKRDPGSNYFFFGKLHFCTCGPPVIVFQKKVSCAQLFVRPLAALAPEARGAVQKFVPVPLKSGTGHSLCEDISRILLGRHVFGAQ